MAHPKGSRPIRSVSASDLTDSDDVSALSMAGASVIAYRAQQLTLNQNVEIDATIREDDAEHDVADEGGGLHRLSSDKSKKSPPNRRPTVASTSVNPNAHAQDVEFADDHQLLDRHKKKKKKHKSKKHKHRHKDCIDVVEYDMSLPINEICFPTVDGPSNAGDDDSASRPPKGSQSNPSVASTAESTGRRDSSQMSNSESGAYNTFVVNTFRSDDNLPDIPQSTCNRSSFSHHSSNAPSSNVSQHSEDFRSSVNVRSCNQSCHGSYATKSHLSGHDSLAHISHISGHDSALRSHVSSRAAFSHITVEDIQHIRNELESAKIEEMKVLELHSKLEAEILKLIEQVEAIGEHKLQVSSELKSASLEREKLQTKLNAVLDDNTKMTSRLQSMEEKEDEKRLDDVLDGMQAKMRALRLRSAKKGRGAC
jgi:hypothetical protein